MTRAATSDARQLLRLRGLRVQRAREQVAAAQAGVERAREAIRERELCIERDRRAVDDLADQVTRTLAPCMPRWAEVAAAERERRAEQLERDEYALISDEHDLEQAQEALQQARAALTRALAREEAVRGMADGLAHADLLARDQRAELELEDQSRPSTRRTP